MKRKKISMENNRGKTEAERVSQITTLQPNTICRQVVLARREGASREEPKKREIVQKVESKTEKNDDKSIQAFCK